MPSPSVARSDCKYAPIQQGEDVFSFPSGSYSSHSGVGNCEESNVVYHEMNDLEFDASGNDTSSTIAFENMDQKVGFWPRSLNYQRTHCCFATCKHCRKFTGREIFLLCLTLLLALILIIFMVFLWAPGSLICTTSECIHAATMVSDSLDETVNPCDDFYQFACGGWMKNNPLPSGHAHWDTFEKQKRSIEARLKNLLESDVVNSTELSSERKAKTFYKSCLDLKAINENGIKPLLKIIKEVGGWSIGGEWNESKFDLNTVWNRVQPFGIATLASTGVIVDLKNVNQTIFAVGSGALSLGQRKYYINKTLDDEVLKAYREYMTEAAVLLGGDKKKAFNLTGDVLLLEQRLASLHLPPELKRNFDTYYKYITIEKLQNMVPEIDWMSYINSSMKEVLKDETLNKSEIIGTSAVEYLSKLSDIINTTPIETLNNLIIWQLVSLFIPPLGQDFLDIRSKLNKKMYGSDSSCLERWRLCVNAADASLGLAVGKMFVENNFDQQSKKEAEMMVREIKNAFKRNLPNTAWIDSATEQKAIEKVDAVKDMIGFPDYILNQTRVDDEYKDFTFTEDMTYFDLCYRYYLFSRKVGLKGLRQPVDKTIWEMTPPTINAYYSPTENTIVLPAGILQPPAYSSKYPQSINFGGIGLVVGHELTHGFDDEGRKFGLDGNLNDWWQNDTAEKFHKKALCMVEQYNKYTVEGQHINGNVTLGENIADNGGLRLAFGAYKKWRDNGNAKSKDPLLPSVDYNHEQLFFISFAQLWCSVATPEYMKKAALVSSHSPNKIRVIATASNSEEFSKAFQCPLGSPMNPKKKCTVW